MTTLRGLRRRLERLEARSVDHEEADEVELGPEAQALLREVLTSIGGPERAAGEAALARPVRMRRDPAGAASRELLEDMLASLEHALEAQPERQ